MAYIVSKQHSTMLTLVSLGKSPWNYYEAFILISSCLISCQVFFLFLFVCSAVSLRLWQMALRNLNSFDEWQWYLATANAFYTPKRIPQSEKMEPLYSPEGSLGEKGSFLLVRLCSSLLISSRSSASVCRTTVQTVTRGWSPCSVLQQSIPRCGFELSELC